MKANENLKDDLLNSCYLIMAKIIRDGGEIYLPIFERLHDERLKRQKSAELINAALQATHKIVD